jgi:serine/threonine-protein kinase ULK2
MQYIDLPADKKIEQYSFNFKSVLGEGSFSKVYLGKNDDSNELVAIKVVEFKSLKDEFAMNLLKSEIKILKELKHPNILRCYDVITTSNNIYIITEYCEGGDLGTILEQRRFFPGTLYMPINLFRGLFI